MSITRCLGMRAILRAPEIGRRAIAASRRASISAAVPGEVARRRFGWTGRTWRSSISALLFAGRWSGRVGLGTGETEDPEEGRKGIAGWTGG